MRVYYLYECEVERRNIIDSGYRGGAAYSDAVEADSWLDAKRKLGFDLTAAQQWLLGEQKRRAA